MFSKLNEVKTLIRKDINNLEDDWSNNPQNDYYFGEICGLNRALGYILRVEARAYTDLDKWAETLQQGKDKHEHRNRKDAGH
jgi:hypothetical protein|tara:strand:+ start:252 stop:497 length:246 start_codon:yes stop_codon:yes gene_type:complete